MLRAAPALTLLLFLTPVAAGLAGTLAPAFGVLPGLPGPGFGLAPWQALLDRPGVFRGALLALGTGVAATALSLGLALLILAAAHGTTAMEAVRRVLAPLLAIPHAALAIGLAFLLAPSGWIVRLLSPWATGWNQPPDLATVQDPWGLALILGLVLKETPFLLFMALGAMAQGDADRRGRAARLLGYGPVAAWAKAVLPALYPRLRLPVYAVLAYSVSVVDVAIVLGPTTPPTLAVMVFRWLHDPDLAQRFPAAAGATLLLLLAVAAMGGLRALEWAVARATRPWLLSGRRGGSGGGIRALALAAAVLTGGLAALAMAGLALWSAAARWRFPDPLPGSFGTGAWQQAGAMLGPATANTVLAGAGATLLALVLTVACLEWEARRGRPAGAGAQWLLYLPLLLPQIAFLLGVQILLIRIGLHGTWPALVWSHLLFVLPYVFLTLAGPWRSFDRRYLQAAAILGSGPLRAFCRVTLPLLARPLAIAAAVGFSVSAAQYLPTLLAGGGWFPTLTTEAVALASGGDRRLAAAVALVQAAVPLVPFALALMLARREAAPGGSPVR